MVVQVAVLDGDHLVGADVVVVDHRHALDPLAHLGEGVDQDQRGQQHHLDGRGGVGAHGEEPGHPAEEEAHDEPPRQLIGGLRVGGLAAPERAQVAPHGPPVEPHAPEQQPQAAAEAQPPLGELAQPRRAHLQAELQHQPRQQDADEDVGQRRRHQHVQREQQEQRQYHGPPEQTQVRSR